MALVLFRLVVNVLDRAFCFHLQCLLIGLESLSKPTLSFPCLVCGSIQNPEVLVLPENCLICALFFFHGSDFPVVYHVSVSYLIKQTG